MKLLQSLLVSFTVSQYLAGAATAENLNLRGGRNLQNNNNNICPCFTLQDLIIEFGRPNQQLAHCDVSRVGLNQEIQGGSVVVDYGTTNRACAGTQCFGSGTCARQELTRPQEISDPEKRIPYQQERHCVDIIEDFCTNHRYQPASVVLGHSDAVLIRSNRFVPYSNLYLTASSCNSGSDVTVESYTTDNEQQAKQQWRMKDDGTIESVYCPGQVLDIRGSNCNGGDIILWPSHGGINQEWSLSQPQLDTTSSHGGSLHTITSFRCPSRFVAASNEATGSHVDLARDSYYQWRIDNV